MTYQRLLTFVITYFPNTRCDANTPNGELHAVVTDPGGMEPAGGYTYLWAEAGGALHPTATGQGTPDLTLIPEGTYSLTVTNNDTGCETVVDNYVLTNEAPQPLEIAVSTAGNTNCVNPNGKMAVTILGVTIPGSG